MTIGVIYGFSSAVDDDEVRVVRFEPRLCDGTGREEWGLDRIVRARAPMAETPGGREDGAEGGAEGVRARRAY